MNNREIIANGLTLFICTNSLSTKVHLQVLSNYPSLKEDRTFEIQAFISQSVQYSAFLISQRVGVNKYTQSTIVVREKEWDVSLGLLHIKIKNKK